MLMGEILIAGLASLLISIFLGPKFIEFLREREFGQHIREEGPAEHHLKAGTPTMGGLVIFTAIAIPYLILSDRDAASLAVFGDRARVRGDRLRRRLAEDRQGALARAVGAHEARAPAPDRDRRSGTSRREVVGLNDTLQFRIFDAQVDIGGFYVVLVFLVLAGRDQRRQPDRRPRRARRRLRRDRAAHLHGDRVHHRRAGRPVDHRAGRPGAARRVPRRARAIGFLWFNSFPAAIFMGDTGSLGLGGAIAGHGGDDEVRGAADRDRRHLRDRGAVGAAQVFAFRLFRRRILLMAPIHHHFELMGWSETKIIVRFWIIGRDRQRDRLHALPAEHRRLVAARERMPRPPLPRRPVPGRRAGALRASRRRWRCGRPTRAPRSSPATAARPPEALEAAGRACAGGRRSPPGYRWNGASRRIAAASTLVKSPGVPAEAPVVARARERGLEVVGELELGWRLLPNEFCAVTGTNGKTTTTELIGAIYRAAGVPVAVAGNVGTPRQRARRRRRPGARPSSARLELPARGQRRVRARGRRLPQLRARTTSTATRRSSDYLDAKLRVFANQRRATSRS